MSIEQYGSEVRKQLANYPDQVARVAPDFLSANIAEPLADAVEGTFCDATQNSVVELIATLSQLDEDLGILRAMAGESDTRPSQFETWARYWTSVSPEVESVRKLVHEQLAPNLTPIRTRLRGFTVSVKVDHANGRLPMWRAGTSTFRDAPRGSSLRSFLVSVWRVLNLGMRPAMFSADIPWRDVVALDGVSSTQAFGTAGSGYGSPRLCESLRIEFERYALADPQVSEADALASNCVPNATFKGIGRIYAGEVSREYRRVCQTAGSQVSAGVPAMSNGTWSLSTTLTWPAICFLGGSVTAGLVFMMPAWPPTKTLALMHLTRHSFTIAVAVVAWAFICFVLACTSNAMLRARLARRMVLAVTEQSGAATTVWAAEAAQAVTETLLDHVLREASVQLSPRPLQRAISNSLR